MLAKKIEELLKSRSFISVATCDLEGRPNAAPKFLLKAGGNFVYLVDYSISRTWGNLKVNPQACLSFMEKETLKGYQIYGHTEIIEDLALYESALKELQQKQIDLSTQRIIEGLASGKVHEAFEVGITDRIVIFKIKIEEVTEVGPQGDLRREKVCGD